jgi:hypothetical protein
MPCHGRRNNSLNRKALQTFPWEHSDSILETLRRTMENSDSLASSARAAAVLWANQCFPFNNSAARIINVIDAGDERPDVREAAIAGLSAKRYRKLTL